MQPPDGGQLAAEAGRGCAMRRAIRAYFRKNAAALAERFADKSIVYGKGGGHFRASDDGAVRIVRAAFEKHFANISRPTVVKLTMEDARCFPGFQGHPDAGDVAWLVVVSDSSGETAYGVVQEGCPTLDRQIREGFAKARAQQTACEILLEMRRLDRPTAGSA